MNTAEMVLLADTNSKTYQSGNIRYSQTLGFYDMHTREPWPTNTFDSLTQFIHWEGWHISEYTLEELYRIVGHKFDIVE